MITIVIFERNEGVRNVYEKFISTFYKDAKIFKFSETKDVLNFLKENSVQILVTEYVPDERCEDKTHDCGNAFLQEIMRISPETRIMICTNYIPDEKNSKDNIILRKPVHKGDFIGGLKSLLKT